MVTDLLATILDARSSQLLQQQQQQFKFHATKIDHCFGRKVTGDRGFFDWLVDGVLYPDNIKGHVRMATNLRQCALMATSLVLPTGRPGRPHHDLISHSAAVSGHQSMSYPNNAMRLARK